MSLFLISILQAFSGVGKEICEQSNLEIVKQSIKKNHFPPEIDFQHLSNTKEQLSNQWNLVLPKTRSYVPWMLMNHPRTEVKEVAHRIQKYMIKKYFMGENPEIDPELNQSFANYFASHLNYHHEYSRKYLNFINNKIEKIENNSGKFQKLKKEFDQYSFWLCSNYFSLSCNQALPNALTMLNPRENPYQSGGSFSLLTPLRDFLTDSSLSAPLNLAATKIRNILREARAGEFKGETHLYRAIFDSFKHFGVSNSQAREKTWLILGIYGTRGSAINSFIDILHEENRKLFVPLYYISTAINLIDHYMLKNTLTHRTFTLPPGITTGCDYAKPYHFWLTAYLAKKLKNLGFSSKVSSLTPHLLGVMYQFAGIFSEVDKAFYEHKYSPSNNAIRVNLSFNDLGAIYGSGMKREIFHNTLLLNMMKKARTLNITDRDEFEKEINSSKLRKYYYWDQVIAPSANYLTLFSNK